MATGFSLPISIDLKSFTTKLGEARSALAQLAGAPVRALATAFGPAIEGAHKFASAIKESQLAIGATAVALGAGIKESLAAFNADESAAARVAATFGENAGAVNAAVAGIAQSTGRAVGDISGMAAQFGVLIEGAGLSGQKTAELSTQFSQLAIDIGARFGKPTAEVFGDLQGGLLGMERSVRQYGISLSEEAKQAEATRLGLNPNDLTEQQQHLVDLNIILGQTAKFQGAAAAASGTLREKMAVLVIQFGELQGAIGSALQRAVLPLVNRALDVVAALRKWTEENPKLASSIGAAVVSFTAFGAALASVGAFLSYGLPLLGALAQPFLLLLNPVSAVVAGFTALLGATALGGLIDGFAKFVANGQGIQNVFDGIEHGIAAISGAFQFLKEGIAAIGGNVFARLENDAGAAGAFFEQLGNQISTALQTAFEFVLPIANQVVETIIAVFEELPTTWNLIGTNLRAFGQLVEEVLSIVLGTTVKSGDGFKDLQSIAINALEAIQSALTGPGIITGLARVRQGVAFIAGACGEMLQVAKLVGSGLEFIFLGWLKLSQLSLAALGHFNATAKTLSQEMSADIDQWTAKALERNDKIQADMVKIAVATAKAIDAAQSDIDNAPMLAKKAKEDLAARNAVLKVEQQKTAEQRKQIAADEQQRKADAAYEKQEEAAFTTLINDEAKLKELTQKQGEALKQATSEAVQAELSLEDARVKANGLLSEEIALLNRRRDIEIATARERFASEQEIAQIKRKFRAEATGLKEERKRQDEKQSGDLQDFTRGVRRDSKANSRDGKENGQAIAEEFGNKFKDQFDKVKTNDDAQELIGAMQIAGKDIRRKLLEEVNDLRKQLRDAPIGADRDELEKKLENAEAKQDAAGSGIDAVKSKAKDIVHRKVLVNEADQAGADGERGADNGNGTATVLTPIDQAKQVLSSLGGKFQELVNQLGTKLEGFGDQVLVLSNATAALVKTADIFPKISTSLDALVTSQSTFGAALSEFGGTTLSQIGTMNELFTAMTYALTKQQAAIKGFAGQTQANRDAVANFGDL